jgi:hypothetical protein
MLLRQNVCSSPELPDTDVRLAFALHSPNVPPRDFRPMHPEAIVAWTPVRLLRGFALWLLEEERLWGGG